MLEKKECEKLSEAEAQLYDRQIRLWGLDAQKRLRSSRILVIGIQGLGCEVAKNLVLAGVKSLKMLDNGVVTHEDAASQFLAPRDKIGMNRAEASKERLEQLNPMVEISVDSEDPTLKEESYFADFDIVVATTLPKEIYVRINAFCRNHGSKFFAGDVVGFFGYTFMDLIDHEYVEEVAVTKDEIAGDEPQSKKSKTSSEEPETKMVKNKASYVSLEKALAADWNSESYAKRIKRMDAAYFVLQVIFEFRSREGSLPRSGKRQDDLKLLNRLKEDIEQKFNLPDKKISPKMMSMLFGELSPVAAIVGGVLGQEIIKTISNKDAPHNNFFLYNPIDGAGIVESIGY